MYKRKLFYFGLATSFILFLALSSTAVSTHLTRTNLAQSSTAQALLIEHEKLSSVSYRLFKQLTDGVILGQNANQAFVRNKREIIEQSIARIKVLEEQQASHLRLDENITFGQVTDAHKLMDLINQIINEFDKIVINNNLPPLEQQEQLSRLLEVTIDDEFRESITAAVTRQGQVVAAINARIDILNTSILWFTIGLAALSFPLIIYGCYWLFNQLYQPITLLSNATNSIASGNYEKPISVNLDEEFKLLSQAINYLAERLQQHEKQESNMRKQLELDVKQRTSELTEANLQLTKIDSRRRQFIADVSHELRTPLTIIRGESQVTLRMKSASPEEYRETLQSILQQSIALSRLVDDLLLLTRAEMNQLNLELLPTSIVPLVTSEVQKWQRSHRDRIIKIDIAEELEDSILVVDQARIQQALSILIDNALKYSGAKAEVSIALKSEDTRLQIIVSDNGVGISAAEVDSIFERFVRFSKHTEGSGLGLPIAKAIVERHDGQISVRSSQGLGAVFTISLPLEQQM